MRSARVLAWLAAASQIVVWVAIALLAWPDHLGVATSTPFMATFFSFGVAGLLLVGRRPRQPVGWLMLGFGILASTGVGGMLLASRLIDGGAPIAGAWSDAIGNALMTAGMLAVPAILILFPDGAVPRRHGLPLLWLVAITAVAGAGAALLNGGWGGDPNEAIAISPLREGTAPVGDVVAQVFLVALNLSVIGASGAQLHRWRHSTGLERQQIKWLAMSAALVVVALASAGFSPGDQWEVFLMATALSLIPLAIVVAILRYRLYDIDRIISRTVSYAVVVGLLGMVALGSVTAMAFFLPNDDPLVVAVATLTVFALFNPLRIRVQRVVDRRFNRSRYDAERVVDDFSGALRDQANTESLLSDWVEVVEETMQPSSLSVWVRSE